MDIYTFYQVVYAQSVKVLAIHYNAANASITG
jgi:hypothetical protein